MATITISKELMKEKDLIILPRKEYERLFRFWANAEPISQHTKKSIKKGLKEIAKGDFLTSNQVKNALGL